MKIKIAQDYRPFSHEVGTSLLLPGSPWRVTAYPAKVVLENLSPSSEKPKSHVLFPHILGPVSGFTALQDLERKWIRIFGLGKEGYFSYRITALDQGITLFVERGPEEGLFFTFQGKKIGLSRKQAFHLPSEEWAVSSKCIEKMHFGCAKKQDWTLVKRRLNLRELLPIWFALGISLPRYPVVDVGTYRYLKRCIDLVDQNNRVQIGPSLIELFQFGFEGLFSPHLFDNRYQSYAPSELIDEKVSPLILLTEGARLIRKLLIDVRENGILVLPCLPKEIHAGRFINIDFEKTLVVDLEWSKKCIRRLILHPKEDQTRTFLFQKPFHSFRLRKGRFGKGVFIPIGTPLELKKEHLYILDRFQK